MTQETNIFPFIERLLQGAEVVWKPLGEVAELKRGITVAGFGSLCRFCNVIE